LWNGYNDVSRLWEVGTTWTPAMDFNEAGKYKKMWHKAVTRAMNWI